MAVNIDESLRALGALCSHLVKVLKVLHPVRGCKVVGVATLGDIYKLIVR